MPPIELVENSVVAGRFRLSKMIGRGGMGSVWQATHLGLDIPCAVKFMEGAKSVEAQARFEREAKAAAQLRSPHVVQVLDHGVCEGTPYIAMELLDGEDLGKRLLRLKRIHPRELNVIITQVCRALSKAHALRIVHRDLKPDNIFLVHDDDREIAKVLDFGIAKSSAAALEGGNTKTGAMLGTPYYMSPEQAQGVKSVDYRSDLWSLAVIVYQCITGALPFESDALGDLLMRIIVQPLPVPSQVAEVPAGFDKWWAKGASRDPAGRFQSAKEFAESLQIVFGGSQATDVMDRVQMKAALGATPQPGSRSPLVLPTPQGPQPLPPTSALAASTGAPIARTLDGGGAPAPPAAASKRTGIVIAAASAALFVLATVAGIGFVRSKMGPVAAERSAAQATAPAPVPAPVVSAAPVLAPAPPPAASAPPVATAASSPSAPAASASAPVTASPPPLAPAPPPARARHAGGSPAPVAGGANNAAPPPPAAPPARPQPPAATAPEQKPASSSPDFGY